LNFLGIDVGRNGGFVLLSENKEIIEKFVPPIIGNQLDILNLSRLLKEIKPKVTHAFLENVSARPGQGVVSMFRFGYCFGVKESLLTSLGIPYTLVTPQSWTKIIHKGVSRKLTTKQRSLIIVNRLFPDLDLRKSSRCSIPHSGLVDGLLIAEYGRRLHLFRSSNV